MGVAIRISFLGLDRAVQARLEALEHLDPEPLLDAIGALVESQTKARIAAGGPAPDGTPWAAWSDRYAKTRHAGQSLLRSEGYLFDSITHLPIPGGVEVGTARVYGRIHQLGGEITMKARTGTLRLRTTGSRGRLKRQAGYPNLAVFAQASHVHFVERLVQVAQHTITIPARPYLGLSSRDEAEVTDLCLGFLERAIA